MKLHLQNFSTLGVFSNGSNMGSTSILGLHSVAVIAVILLH